MADCFDIINPDAPLPLPPNADPDCADLAKAEWALAKGQAIQQGCACQQLPLIEAIKCIIEAWGWVLDRQKQIMDDYWNCVNQS